MNRQRILWILRDKISEKSDPTGGFNNSSLYRGPDGDIMRSEDGIADGFGRLGQDNCQRLRQLSWGGQDGGAWAEYYRSEID